MSTPERPIGAAPTLPARDLPELLRRQFAQARGVPCSLLVATVVSAPDSRHVRIVVNGVNADIAKLTSYAAPVAGEPCYVLIADGTALAIGAVR
jgi:hypothetical protein